MGLVSLLLLALAPAACRKEPAAPSEDYEQARQRFSKLYGQKLDEAFVDPEMESIEAQLQQVPADSMDAQAARELLQRIQQGRARVEAAQQETEAAIAQARQVEDFPSRPAEPAPAAEPEPAAPADAGTSAGPVAGTPASELSSGYERCFRRGQQVNIEGRGPREAWEMENRAACRQTYPSFIDQVILVEEERVLLVLPRSAVRVTYVGPDGGPAPGR